MTDSQRVKAAKTKAKEAEFTDRYNVINKAMNAVLPKSNSQESITGKYDHLKTENYVTGSEIKARVKDGNRRLLKEFQDNLSKNRIEINLNPI